MINVYEHIICFISVLIFELLLPIVYFKLENIKDYPKYNYLKILLLIIISLIINYLDFVATIPSKIIISILSFSVPYFIFLKYKKQETFVNIIFVFFLSNILDLIFSLILEQNLLDNLYLLYLFVGIFTILLPIIIILILDYTKLNYFLQKAKYYVYSNLKIFIMILIMFCIIFFLLGYEYKYFILFSTRELFFNTSLIIILIIFIIYLIRLEIKNIEINKYNLYLINNIKGLSNVIKEEKCYVHNIKNQLLSLLSINSVKTIHANIEEMTNTKRTNSADVQNGQVSSALGSYIYNIINEKKYNFSNVILLNEIKNEEKLILNYRTYSNICESIGVVLNNAIDESRKIRNAKIIVKLTEDNCNYKIVIINNYKNNINISLLGTVEYTTKLNGHGYGLYSIFKNKNIKFKIEVHNDIFKSIIIVKK
jgi:two-component system sensor histidine kinase AgrC